MATMSHAIIKSEKETCQIKLYEKIKRERKRPGLSQEKLGEKIGVSRQAITKWENEFSHS